MKFGRATLVAASMVAFAVGPAASQSPWPQAEPQATPSAWPQQPAPAAAPAQTGPSPWDRPAAPPQQAIQQPMQAPPQQAQDPWSAKPQAQQEPPPCVAKFLELRKDVEKHGGRLQAAGQRKDKPSPKEACGLFNAFTGAEAKMIKYAAANAASCGIPAQVIDNMKQANAKSSEIRARVCQVAAAGPPRPAAPSLSDALSAPVTSSGNVKTGRGTFDTLTGNPLTR